MISSLEKFKNYLKEEGITHIFTAINHFPIDRLNERTGQTLMNQIQCRTNENEGEIIWCTITGSLSHSRRKQEVGV